MIFKDGVHMGLFAVNRGSPHHRCVHQVSRNFIFPPDGVNRVLRLCEVVVRLVSVRTYDALSNREVDPLLVKFGATPYFLCFKVAYYCFWGFPSPLRKSFEHCFGSLAPLRAGKNGGRLP